MRSVSTLAVLVGVAVLGAGVSPAGSARVLAPSPIGSSATPASIPQAASVPYDGRFTFTRIRYRSGGRGFGRFGGGAWAHDYPAADRNMQVMLNEFTAMRATTEGSNVFDLEDRSIFQYPILYISDGSRSTVQDSSLVHDSLFGSERECRPSSAPGVTICRPLSAPVSAPEVVVRVVPEDKDGVLGGMARLVVFSTVFVALGLMFALSTW